MRREQNKVRPAIVRHAEPIIIVRNISVKLLWMLYSAIASIVDVDDVDDVDDNPTPCNLQLYPIAITHPIHYTKSKIKQCLRVCLGFSEYTWSIFLCLMCQNLGTSHPRTSFPQHPTDSHHKCVVFQINATLNESETVRLNNIHKDTHSELNGWSPFHLWSVILYEAHNSTHNEHTNTHPVH